MNIISIIEKIGEMVVTFIIKTVIIKVIVRTIFPENFIMSLADNGSSRQILASKVSEIYFYGFLIGSNIDKIYVFIKKFVLKYASRNKYFKNLQNAVLMLDKRLQEHMQPHLQSNNELSEKENNCNNCNNH